MVTLRRFGAADGPSWLTVQSSVAAEGRWIAAEAPVDPASCARTVTRFADRSDAAMFLGFVADQPISYIHVEINGGGVAVFGMAIVEGFRGQGTGSEMMTVAMDWARSAGAQRLRVDVFPDNDRAIALYRKFGFTESERRVRAWPRRSGELWDLVGMERDCAPARS